MNKYAHAFFALWLVIAGSIGSPQPCFAEPPVTLHSAAEVQQATVRLSDVFGGIPAAIDEDIAQAPAPGKQMVYDVNVLTRLAKKYQLDWRPRSQADNTVITTAFSRITLDAIQKAVVQKLTSDDAYVPQKGGDVDVSLDSHAQEIDFPTDQMPDFTLNNFTYDPTAKRFRADLFAQTTSGPFTVQLSGRLVIKRSVPVLAHHLDAGTVVGTADLDWMPVAEDRLNNSVITDAAQLVGHELRHEANEGELLHTHDIIPPRLVVRGTIVTIKIETPLMLMTAQGKALQDGTMGDSVRVTNTQSNRMVEGTVTGPGTVLITTTPQKVAVAQ